MFVMSPASHTQPHTLHTGPLCQMNIDGRCSSAPLGSSVGLWETSGTPSIGQHAATLSSLSEGNQQLLQQVLTGHR